MKRNYFLLILSVMALAVTSCKSRAKLASRIMETTYMQQAFADLKDSVKEAQVTIVEDTIKVLFPDHLLFNTASSEVLPMAHPYLKRFANTLNKYTLTDILVNGYTDTTGSDGINDKLSLERAESTKMMLVNDEVSAVRLYTWGFGSKHPIASNSTEKGRRKNRRVEFIVLYRK